MHALAAALLAFVFAARVAVDDASAKEARQLAEGITAAIDSALALLDGEESPPRTPRRRSSGGEAGGAIAFFARLLRSQGS